MSVRTANEATAGLAKKGQNEASGSGKMMSHPDVKIPSYIGQSITSLLVFIMAATMRGNSRLYCVESHMYKVTNQDGTYFS